VAAIVDGGDRNAWPADLDFEQAAKTVRQVFVANWKEQELVAGVAVEIAHPVAGLDDVDSVAAGAVATVEQKLALVTAEAGIALAAGQASVLAERVLGQY
jgi:hypothetical protein